jgi:hypothetical protein
MMFYRDHKWKPTTYEKPKDHDWFIKNPLDGKVSTQELQEGQEYSRFILGISYGLA